MRLYTFGRLVIAGDDDGSDVRLQRRQLALLAVLSAEGASGVSRDRLLGLFSADVDPARARHQLDQAVYALRRVIGADALVSGPVSMQLDAAHVSSDVGEFTAALERGDLVAVADLYRGPFLDGVFIPDAPEFERWAEGRRGYFAGAFVQALMRLAATAIADGAPKDAVGFLRRATAADPLSAAPTQALMLALGRSGDLSAALNVARVHSAMVREQLDADPDPAITSLERELRAGRVPGSATAETMRAPEGAAGGAASPVMVPVVARSRSVPRTALIAAVGVLTLIGIGFGATRLFRRPPGFVLRDLTQLTTNGESRTPAISADGKYLAYATKECDSTARCDFGLDIQEIGSTAIRRILEHAGSIEFAAWSPDSRNLLAIGVIGGRDGTYLISALGGVPIFLGVSMAAFFAGGDSLLMLPPPGVDSVARLSVLGLDGAPRGYISIAGAGAGGEFDEIVTVPGTDWIIVAIRRGQREEVRVVDHRGREIVRRDLPAIMQNVRATHDAVWFSFPQGHSNSVLVRSSLDVGSGHLAVTGDTLYSGVFSEFDLTDDGERLVVDQETEEFGLWALDFADAERGVFAPKKRLLRNTTGIDADLSPDGTTIPFAQALGLTPGGGWKLSVIPFAGGAVRVLPVRGKPIGQRWPAPGAFAIGEEEGDTTRFALIDPATGARRGEFTLAQSGIRSFTPIPGGGWAWVPPDGQSVHTQGSVGNAARVFPKPAWYRSIHDVIASPDGSRLVYCGVNASGDTVRVSVLDLRDGATVSWWTGPAALDAYADWFPDGSLRVRVWVSRDTLVFSRLRRPGRVEQIGAIHRPTQWAAISADLRHLVAVTREAGGDVWMSRVVRR